MENIALEEPVRDVDRDAIMTAKNPDSKIVKKQKNRKRGNRRTLIY